MPAPYLYWNQQIVTDFSAANITALYHEGYLFTRLGKALMRQTRSVRIDLSKFELSSENRRILRKTENLFLAPENLPLKNYHWQIGKMVKKFYDAKFGPRVFSANKARELLTDKTKSSFNLLLAYSRSREQRDKNNALIGGAICYKNSKILHYSYPFYDLSLTPDQLSKNIGMGMMLEAIIYSQEKGCRHIYLGSAQRPGDRYKLQFTGLEWFDGKRWQRDLQTLKKALYS